MEQFSTPPEQHSTEVAFQISNFLFQVKTAEEMEEFLKQLRYPCFMIFQRGNS